MLTVKVFAGLGQPPLTLPASLVIIEDEFGNPISVACTLDSQQAVVAKAGDKDFGRVLQSLGLDRTVIDSPLPAAPKPPAGAKLLTF